MAKTAKRPPWKRSNPRKNAGKPSKHLSPAKKKAAKASAKRAGRPYPNLVDNMRAASKKKTGKGRTAKKAKTKKAKTKKAKTKTASASRKKSTAKKSKTKKSKTKKSKKSKKRAAAKRAVEKDPRGGLTAAGRRAFAKKQGAHLKPGVRKPVSGMTPTDMRRKGSWAVRFYGRAKLPPLVDRNGEPTRHALSAHAWGEPVPKTVAAARRIAAKGERLLERYHRIKTKR